MWKNYFIFSTLHDIELFHCTYVAGWAQLPVSVHGNLKDQNTYYSDTTGLFVICKYSRTVQLQVFHIHLILQQHYFTTQVLQ